MSEWRPLKTCDIGQYHQALFYEPYQGRGHEEPWLGVGFQKRPGEFVRQEDDKLHIRPYALWCPIPTLPEPRS